MQRSPFTPALAKVLRDRVFAMEDSERQLRFIFLVNDILFESVNLLLQFSFCCLLFCSDVLFSIRVMLLRNGEAPKVKAPVLPMQRITLGYDMQIRKKES